MNILEMAMAAKMAGGNGGGTGPIDPKRLPEGYPYKEKGATILDVTHEFPMLRGQQFPAENGGLEAGKVYAVTVTAPNGSVTNNNITAEAGEGYTSMEVRYNSSYMLICEYYPEDNVFDITDSGDGGQFTITIAAPETIHTMAPEFLPAGVGGGYVLEIDPAEHSMSSGGLTVESIDYTPLYQALCQGRNAVIVLVGGGLGKLPMPVFWVDMQETDDGIALLVNRDGYMPIRFTNGSVS